MSERLELVQLAASSTGSFAALCRRFGVSRKTGYKWRERFGDEGVAGLADRSRRPHDCPWRCGEATEQLVLAVRATHPAWGGRKIRAYLRNAAHAGVPAASTITAILHRHGLIDPERSRQSVAYRRFEYPAPNELWQMDFKGDVALRDGGRCHPLTIVDDHSRYAVCVRSCGDQRRETVQTALVAGFRRYGLPARMLMDNGSCWGYSPAHPFTRLGAWLIRLGITVLHGGAYHPQTQGKNERFNRTLKAEVLAGRTFYDHAESQRHFDRWRDLYNFERPHEALDDAVPASRYQPSPRSYPEALPPLEYPAGDTVRQVHRDGCIRYRGGTWPVSKAFQGQPVAIRPTHDDGVLAVYYGHQKITVLDVRESPPPPRGRGALGSGDA